MRAAMTSNKPRKHGGSRAGGKRARPGPTVLLDLRDIDREYGLPYATTRDLVLRGHLPAIRPPGSRRIWIRRVDLEEALQKWSERAS